MKLESRKLLPLVCVLISAPCSSAFGQTVPTLEATTNTVAGPDGSQDYEDASVTNVGTVTEVSHSAALTPSSGATGDAVATATYGALHSFSTGTGVNYPNSNGNGEAIAKFTDFLTVTGAPNTMVTLDFHFTADGVLLGNRGGTASFAYAGYVNGFTAGEPGRQNFLLGAAANDHETQSQSTDIIMVLPVGGRVQFQAGLEADANALGSFGQSWTVSSDFSDTAGLQITSETAGGGFAADSGTSYQAVPEPFSMTIVALGAFGLLRRKR